jgi:hypothetical protein
MAGISKIWEPCEGCAPEFEQQTLIIKEMADDSVKYAGRVGKRIITLENEVLDLEDKGRTADATKLRFERLQQSLLRRGLKIAKLEKRNNELMLQVQALATDVRVRDRRLRAMSRRDGLVQADTGAGR